MKHHIGYFFPRVVTIFLYGFVITPTGADAQVIAQNESREETIKEAIAYAKKSGAVASSPISTIAK